MEVAEMRVKAHRVCADYLGGAWKELKPDDIIIEHVLGGMVNYMFKIALPPGVKSINNEPRNILMKIFSDKLKVGQFGMMIENIIAILLSKKKVAPKVYGVFDGGRLDEFIESRNPSTKDFQNPIILENIIRNLAQLHCLKPPINKNHLASKNLDVIVEKCILGSVPDKIKDNPQLNKLHERFLDLKPQEESGWLRKIRDDIKSRVVFSHNDFHNNNILMKIVSNDSQDDLIRFVDYEASGFNFRGGDLSRLLGCFCLDVIPNPPYFKINSEKYPTEEKQKYIFKLYLNEIEKLTRCSFNMEQEIKNMMKEVKIFGLLDNFNMITISLFNPFEIDVGPKLDMAIGFCGEILETYLREKEKFLKGFINKV